MVSNDMLILKSILEPKKSFKSNANFKQLNKEYIEHNVFENLESVLLDEFFIYTKALQIDDLEQYIMDNKEDEDYYQLLINDTKKCDDSVLFEDGMTSDGGVYPLKYNEMYKIVRKNIEYRIK